MLPRHPRALARPALALPSVAFAAFAAFTTLLAPDDARADAPASATAPPPASSPSPNNDSVAREPERLRIGALAGIGFPRPLTFEAIVRFDRLVAIGGEYSILPASTIGGVRTTASGVAADLRVFPTRGPFFIGARVGHKHFAVSSDVSVPRYGSVAESIDVDAFFVNPRIGLLWTWSSGLSLGVDAGLEIPLSASTTSTVPTGVAAATSIVDAANTYGRGLLPSVDLLKVGFLF